MSDRPNVDKQCLVKSDEQAWAKELKSGNHRMKDWIAESRRRKWRFAGEVARKTDGRWTKTILSWKPCFGFGRAPGRPKTRWSNDLVQFAGDLWQNVAEDGHFWACLEEGFVTRA